MKIKNNTIYLTAHARKRTLNSQKLTSNALGTDTTIPKKELEVIAQKRKSRKDLQKSVIIKPGNSKNRLFALKNIEGFRKRIKESSPVVVKSKRKEARKSRIIMKINCDKKESNNGSLVGVKREELEGTFNNKKFD